jgi:hypothetical protein
MQGGRRVDAGVFPTLYRMSALDGQGLLPPMPSWACSLWQACHTNR